jgi:hypothetical protein
MHGLHSQIYAFGVSCGDYVAAPKTLRCPHNVIIGPHFNGAFFHLA